MNSTTHKLAIFVCKDCYYHDTMLMEDRYTKDVPIICPRCEHKSFYLKKTVGSSTYN